MEIFLNIKKQNTTVRLLVETDGTSDLSKIEFDSKSIFDQYAKKSTLQAVKLKDLKLKEVGQPEDTEHHLTISKVNNVKTPLLNRTLKQIFFRLVEKKYHSFKDFWVFFIIPFQSVYRFLQQDKKLTPRLKNCLDVETKSYNQFINKFVEFQQHVTASRLNPQNGIKDSLEKLVAYGNLLNKALKKEIPFNNALESISKELFDNYSKNQQLVGAIPIFTHHDEKPLPLVVLFRKENDSLFIDIHGLPEGKACKLAPSYELKGNVTSDEMKSLVRSVLMPLFAASSTKSNAKISDREEIRLNNYKMGGLDPFPENTVTNPTKALDWLDAILLEKTTQASSVSPKGGNLIQDLMSTFQRHFPELSFVDRTEWALYSIQKEYQQLIPHVNKLDVEDRLCFIEKLEEEIKAFISVDNLEGQSHTIQQFRNYLEHLQKLKMEAVKQSQAQQKEKLSQKINSGSLKAKMKINPKSFFDLQITKSVVDSENNAVDINLLKSLVASIKKKDAQELHQNLLSIQQALDSLIEEKKYQSAHTFAVKVFELLPPASLANDSFWNIQGGAAGAKELKKELSQVLTLLYKDIWESSLRLNHTYPPYQVLIQLMKGQTIIHNLAYNHSKPGNSASFDFIELENIIHHHPHHRFGWKPEHQKPLKPIINYIEALRGLKIIPERNDTPIKTCGTIPISKHGYVRNEDHHSVHIAKVQLMFSCMMKPDYCLTPFFGQGVIQQGLGLKWLDSLEAQAVAIGAKTKSEIQAEIKKIRLQEVQRLLGKMERLDLGCDTYVTEKECFTICDAKSSKKAPMIAVLPNGHGLPDILEEKYGVVVDEDNTKPLTGSVRAEKSLIIDEDGADMTQIVVNSYFKRHLTDALSSQQGYTEPTLLYDNLQKAPSGQVSQTDNYLLESLKIGAARNNFIQSNSFIFSNTTAYEELPRNREINEGTILETLGFLFNDRHLSDPQIQRTLLITLTKPFLLERELISNPREMYAIAKQLQGLVEKKQNDPQAFPFLLQVGQIIKEFSESADVKCYELEQLIKIIPSFDNKIKVNKTEMTGKEWLESILSDREKEHSQAVIAYLFAMMGRPAHEMDDKTISHLLYAASSFNVVGDTVGIPQFNKIVQNWIKVKLIPQLASKLQKADPSNIIDKWMELCFDPATLSHPSPWVQLANEPRKYENNDYLIDLSTLQIISKAGKKNISAHRIFLPAACQRSLHCLKLFGNKPILAELSRDDNPSHFIYTFNYGAKGLTYRIIHDQSNNNMTIQCHLPSDPYNKASAKEWYVYTPDIELNGSSSLELVIAKNGLWTSLKNRKKAVLFSVPPQEAKRSDMYAAVLNSSGTVQKVYYVKNGCQVAVLDKHATHRVAPFANPEETLILISKGKVKEIHCLDQKSKVVNEQADRWIYHSPKLGQAWEWSMDLPERTLTIRQDTQEKRFLETFGTDQSKFLMPLKQNNDRQYLLFPYEIIPSNEGVEFIQNSMGAVLKNTPLTLSFTQEGGVKASPSTFLYLSYYYCMKKDLERAYFYLEKAKNSAAFSENEKPAFEAIAALFNKITYRSYESIAFQLKGQLVIQDILRTQFSSPVYDRRDEGATLDNFLHVANLYDDYQSMKSKGDFKETLDRLTESDHFKLDRILWSSFKKWTDQQKIIDAGRTSTTAQQTSSATTRIGSLDKDIINNLPQGFFAACIMLSKDAGGKGQPEALEKSLLENPIPLTDNIVRYFFHYYNMIEKCANPQELKEYFLAIPQWELHPPTHDGGKYMASLATYCRLVLILACDARISGQTLDPINIKEIAEVRDGMPYWSRDSYSWIRFLLNLYDLQIAHVITGVAQAISNDIKDSDFSIDVAKDIYNRLNSKYRLMNYTFYEKFVEFIGNHKETLAKIVDLLTQNRFTQFALKKLSSIHYTPLVFKLKCEHVYRFPDHAQTFEVLSGLNRNSKNYTRSNHSYAPPESAASGSPNSLSLQAILNSLKAENLPADHKYFPFEVTEIPKIIDNEKNIDLTRKREIAVIAKEAEARSYSIVQFRHLAENMRETEKMGKSLSKKAEERRGNATKVHAINPIPNVNKVQSRLLKDIAALCVLSEEDKLKIKNDLENLERKQSIAKKYFGVNDNDPAAKKEECIQLQSGLELAFENIKEELMQKSSFTEKEMDSLFEFLKLHIESEDNNDSLKALYLNKNKELIDALKTLPDEKVPVKLKKMLSQTDLYTDFEIIQTTQRLFKDPRYGEWLKQNTGIETLVIEALLYTTAYQQFKKAYELLSRKKDQHNAAQALALVNNGLTMNRYFKPANEIDPLVARKCLVAEARAGIIFRKGQRSIIQKTAKNPQQWMSLRMGLGKTSYGMPAIAEILSEQGKSVVFTVPEKLLKSNRKDFDADTRQMFDMASLEFTMPLVKELPINYIAETALMIEKVFKKKGYVVTTVEELATLHNTCILLEDEKLKLSEELMKNPNEKMVQQVLLLEMRLHHYKKINRLLNGEATELNLPGFFFGDETDDTHNITHEVSIAVGDKVDPSRTVREVSRTVLEVVMSARSPSPLTDLRDKLLKNTYAGTISQKQMTLFAKAISKELLKSKRFLDILGDSGSSIIKKLNADEWADYLSGASDTMPKGLPEWDPSDANNRFQEAVSAAKQIVSTTLKNFLSQKPGNDLGLSDDKGFIVVPKLTKNETKGLRFGDEFEMIFAQYLGYLEYIHCQSLTDSSEVFLKGALKTLKEKSPSQYAKLAADYNKDVLVPLKGKPSEEIPSIFDYLTEPRSFAYRWDILDEVIFDGGYIKRFKEQVHTNVQEIFHRKPCGGITGTLDQYVLPYISNNVTLNLNNSGEKSSTREVEAETFLRLSLNLDKGLDSTAEVYLDDQGAKAMDLILQDPGTTAIINSSGVTSEGKNTLKWIEEIRRSEYGKERSYLFMHPAERIPYLWVKGALKAVPFKTGTDLPANTICMYAPSDVRGVHLPIKKGKVSMFVSSTATPQELVQSLYRARQLGSDHQLVMHIPESLKTTIIAGRKDKISATYGDVVDYLINRTIEPRLELALNAQIAKIKFDLKTTITAFLNEINPEFDRIETWNSDYFPKLMGSSAAGSQVFKALRKLYIHPKEINFKGSYSPRKLVSGAARIKKQFTSAADEIKSLLPELKKGLKESLMINIAANQDRFLELQNARTQYIQKDPLFAVANFAHLTKLQASIQSLNFDDAGFDALLQLKNQLENHKDKQQNLDVKDQIENILTITNELIYGKGKSDLLKTLNGLIDSFKSKEAEFIKYIDHHKKYLPENTIENPIGQSGTNEQVKEMQQEKTQSLEAIEEDPDKNKNSMHPLRNYRPLVPQDVLHGKNNLPKLGKDKPFDAIQVSKEASVLLDIQPYLNGDPLYYIVVDRSVQNTYQITVISKLDYHNKLKSELNGHDYKSVSVYKPLSKGMQWVAGGQGTSCDAPIDSKLMNQLLTVKAYLGYKEEFAEKTPEVERWKKALTVEEFKQVKHHVDNRGTPSQKKIFNDL